MTSDELVPIYGRMLSPFIQGGNYAQNLKPQPVVYRISSTRLSSNQRCFAPHNYSKDLRGILKWNGEKSGGLVDDRADRENGICLLKKFHFRGWHHKKRVNLPKAKREEVVFTSSLFYLF